MVDEQFKGFDSGKGFYEEDSSSNGLTHAVRELRLHYITERPDQSDLYKLGLGRLQPGGVAVFIDPPASQNIAHGLVSIYFHAIFLWGCLV